MRSLLRHRPSSSIRHSSGSGFSGSFALSPARQLQQISSDPPRLRPKRTAPSPWILLGIFGSACATFVYITQQRALDNSDPRLRSKPFPSFGGAPVPSNNTSQTSRTQCARLVADYDFVHFSAGDLLRAEQAREGSAYGHMIQEYIREGKIVPMEVTIKLLENAIRASVSVGKSRFLVDGFPRKMDQAIKFDQDVCQSAFVLFLTCPEEALLERLIERGKTSGREDDNVESIKKRFRTFVETSMPVVEYYRAKNKLVQIDSHQPVEEVYQSIQCAITSRLSL
ncbi:hypothetical protein O181_049130 [Austropuccinia psidii MF-1]|uniref:Nucleoside-diphosphate kinase n=1 Tax=Austropuccinia psidii MF-1 TaxID=1389203 RepID=A0A9Q3DT24_9BASI|nr:hypothetical protein [Austropuccinia psidii MF-1]